MKNNREQKTNQIFSKSSKIRKITKNQFSVDFQINSSKPYLVRKLRNTAFGFVSVQTFITV